MTYIAVFFIFYIIIKLYFKFETRILLYQFSFLVCYFKFFEDKDIYIYTAATLNLLTETVFSYHLIKRCFLILRTLITNSREKSIIL